MEQHNIPQQMINDLAVLDPDWQQVYLRWLTGAKSRRTREDQHRAWKEFLENGVHPGAIEAPDVRAYIRWMINDARYSQSTVNRRLAAINGFYLFVNLKYAYLREDNPCDGAHYYVAQTFARRNKALNS